MQAHSSRFVLRNCQRAVFFGLGLLFPVLGFAQSADPYTDKLKAGDAKATSGDHAGAASDYDAAVADAQTPTQRALALGKKALVLVNKLDYAGAKQAADSALAGGSSIEPVAEVSALQALAKCQLHEKNFSGALESMVRATTLTGVDWAKPELSMIRGDAERGIGQTDAAIASYRSVLDMPGVSNEFKGVAWLNIGLAEQYSRTNAVGAKEAYGKATELNPGLKTEVATHSAKLQ